MKIFFNTFPFHTILFPETKPKRVARYETCHIPESNKGLSQNFWRKNFMWEIDVYVREYY